MQTDDVLIQAADHTMQSLKLFLQEPVETNRQALLTVCRHYNNSGLLIELKPDPAVIVRRLNA